MSCDMQKVHKRMRLGIGHGNTQYLKINYKIGERKISLSMEFQCYENIFLYIY